MGFLLRTIELTATGREIVRNKPLANKQITVGRSAESDVHLPDLAVETHHALVALSDDGMVEVRSAGSLGFTLDGADCSAATIDSGAGAELGFGTYRIAISREDGDVLLTVGRSEDDQTRSGELEQKRGFSLAGVLPGKRIMSWGLAAVILFAFLAVPVVSFFSRNIEAEQTVVGDASWSTGKLSLAHHGLEDRCEACHVRAFESVRDETCLACHEDIQVHAEPARLAVSRGDRPWGEQLLQGVAHSFGKEGPGACSDCHAEHEGPVRLNAPPQQFCAACHGALDANLADTMLGNVSDFGKAHPQFTPAVVVDPVAKKTVPAPLSKAVREDHGLDFPHALHLDQLGGVSRMAGNIGNERGYVTGGLRCKDCHRPSEDGVRFQPIKMERDCEGCHSLSYDRVGGVFRKLRHGDVDQLIADLGAASPVRPLRSARQRPGDYARGRPYHFNYAVPVWKGLRLRHALSDQGVCGECHRPMMQADGKPGVVPVTLVRRYMHKGWFDHAAHKQEKCSTCHRASSSDSSADLLLPGIKTCRTCHEGENAKTADVPSSCAMCHGYHVPAQGWRDASSLKKRR